jgi:cyanophycinase-like exopeptidase
MLKPILTLCSLLLAVSQLDAQAYTSWFTGDTTDVQPEGMMPGLLLAGGGGDNDESMQWLLERAAGGDVVVIRASGSNGYNNYLYSQLGVAVNSVQTIRFDSPEAAQDEYVIQQIRNAECLFIAGGDQYVYYTYWKGTPIEEAINYLLNEKRVPVGGLSAGMAILSRCYYAPSGGSLTAATALGNPFHPNFDVLGKDDFLQPAHTQNLVTDTHYDQRERAGRHVGFLARLAHEHGERFFGIAANEYTAIAIDENGLARAFGDFPEYPDDLVYFLQVNCQEEFLPEIIEPATPLTWNRGQSAVKVYAVPGRPDGSGSFDLNDWQTGERGEWQNWYVEDGELLKIFDTGPDCAATISSTSGPHPEAADLQLFPNPAREWLYWTSSEPAEAIRVFNLYGQLMLAAPGSATRIKVEGLPPGAYLAHFQLGGGQVAVRRFVR